MPEALPTVLEACTPREDVVGADTKVSALAVDLDLIAGPLGEKSVYGDPTTFFRITYPTETLKSVPRQILERITGKNPHAKGIYLLGTALGGGKSHILAALLHLARLDPRSVPPEAQELIGEMPLPRIRVVVLTQSSPAGGRAAPRTLWGEIARQLGKPEAMKEFDDRLQAPPKDALRQLLQGDPVLLLVDEVTSYLIRASAIPVGKSSLATQTRVFFQDLEEVVDQLTNTALVVSQLPEEFEPEHREVLEKAARGKKAEKVELEEHAKREVELTAKILLRKAEPVTPVRDDEELVNILRRRLFEAWPEEAAERVAEAYASYYRTPGVRAALPVSAAEDGFEKKLKRTYPFHPKFVALLRDKLGQAPKFMQTRGALLLAILAVRRAHREHAEAPLLHPFHIDPRDVDIREELSKRVFDDPKVDNAIVTEFVGGPDRPPRARLIDETFGSELGTRLASSILLESALVTHRGLGDPLVGTAEAEVLLDTLLPGEDEARARAALEGILETSYHVEKVREKLVFRGEVNLNRYIDDKAQHVPDHEVEAAIRSRIENYVLKGSTAFDKIWWPTSPEDIEDKPRLQLVVLPPTDPWWHASDEPRPEVKRLFEKKNQAGEPRRYKNTLVFLAPYGPEREKVFRAIRRAIAIQTVRRDDAVMGSLTEEQKRKLEEDRAKAEGMAILRAGMAYRLLFYPAAEGPYRKPVLRAKPLTLAERDVGVDTESWKVQEGRVLGVVQARLRDEDKLREEAPFSPDWLQDRVFKDRSGRLRDSLRFSEIESSFHEDASLPFLYPKELIRRSVEEGVRAGSFAVVSGRRMFTSQVAEPPVVHAESEVVLHDTSRWRELLEQFHEVCGYPHPECKCGPPPSRPPEEPPCPTCGRPESQCVCEIVRRDVLLKDVPGIVVGELQARKARAREVALDVSKPDDVALLLKIVPQFGGARATAELTEIYVSTEAREAEARDSALLRGTPPGAFWPLMKGAAESLLAQIVSGKATGNARAHLVVRMKEPADPRAVEEILRPLTIPGSEMVKVTLKARPEART